MAKPRIFVSSTYYDLRLIRADLERFIRDIGYEPVLFERGHIPYGKDEALEEYCYREIATCDVVVTVIGGKYGTQSKDGKASITQKELKTAIEQGKQIYIFVDKAVLAEYRTWLANKESKDFKTAAASDVRVHQFIEEMYGLPSGNPIEGFEFSDDIVRFLKEQWAGLFQRLLNEESRAKEVEIIESLKATATTLSKLVTFVTEAQSKGNEAIKDILLSTHPAFAPVKKALKAPYRVVFHNFGELNPLFEARNYVREKSDAKQGYFEWRNVKAKKGVRVSKAIFDQESRLKVITPEEWKSDYVEEFDLAQEAKPADDDVPF